MCYLASVTALLKKAFDEAAKLPDEEQEEVARVLLERLASEANWNKTSATSATRLRELADEALEEHRSGRTEELDPDKL